MLFIDVITLFPVVFDGISKVSMWKKAQELSALRLNIWNLRDFSRSKQYKVDAPVFGGGAGMLLRAEPLFSVVEQLKTDSSWVIALSPAGNKLTQEKVYALSQKEHIIFICGHYEGIDYRVIEDLVDEQLSIGDYVLTGGEIAAMVTIDALLRYLPGVLGNALSLKEESFAEGLLEYPQYTRPRIFRSMRVPELLLSGDHEKIKAWRKNESIKRTRLLRPDLLERRK